MVCVQMLFKDVMKMIHPVYHCETFTKSTQIDRVSRDFEILHISYDAGNYGHYCGAMKDGNTVHFFDSMGTSDYTQRFIKYIRQRYGKVKVIQDYKDTQFQEYDCDYTLRSVGPSKHQYCYLEALVYLFHKVHGTPMGPLENRVKYLKDCRRKWIAMSKSCLS